ncbi:MAG: hydantoinase/oxoprolinase family protein, partial [Pseudonocardia sp.]
TSALGCLLVDSRQDFSRMFIRDVSAADPYEIESMYLELEAVSRESLVEDHVEQERISLQRFVEMRYRGQSRSLSIAVDGSIHGVDGLTEKFHTQHHREFGFSQPGAVVEFYQLAVSAIGVIDKPQVVPGTWGAPPLKPSTRRRVRLDTDAWIDTPVFERAHMFPGARVEGPALVSQTDSTTLLPPGSAAVVDDMLNLRVTPTAQVID